MKIVVCIKQVPNTTEIKIDKATGTMIREGIDSIINPDDRSAIEAALQIKEKIKEIEDTNSDNTKIILLSMGPPQAENALLEGLAMGCDDAILLSDRKFAGSDTAATSYILSKAIEKIGKESKNESKVDLILCGRQAIDGDTAQTGPQIAELLNIPQITYVRKIDLKNKENKDTTKLIVERQMENNYEIIECHSPILLTIIKEYSEPRYPTLMGIKKSVTTKIKRWTNDDINAKDERIGLVGSPTKVKKSFSPERKNECKFIEGNTHKEIAVKLLKVISK